MRSKNTKKGNVKTQTKQTELKYFLPQVSIEFLNFIVEHSTGLVDFCLALLDD